MRRRLSRIAGLPRRGWDRCADFWSRSSRARRGLAATVAALVIFLAALGQALGYISHAADWGWSLASGHGGAGNPWSSVVVERKPILTNGEAESSSFGGQTRWKKSTVPQVDFTVRNEGDQRVVLGRVRIAVRASDRITSCEPPQGGEGGVPVDESVFVDLPLFPPPGERVLYRALHREIPPHHVTRIKLYFRALDSEFADELFHLDVALLGPEPDQQTAIGRFVVSVPGAVPRFSSFLPESTEVLDHAELMHVLLPSSWCFRRNLAVVHRFLAMKGTRSEAMSALADVHPPPGWSAAGDSHGAAESARSLIYAGDFFVGPTLALFAAEASGDRSLLAATRREARVELRRMAERDLEGGPPAAPRAAVVDVRTMLSLEDGDGARSLLGRAEAALRQTEAASR